MNYTQNEKIMQVKNSTLVVGVDIAKNKHAARAFNFRGIEYDKAIFFENNEAGFKKLLHWIKKVSEKENKTNVIVGMEPTGHYWLPLEEYLRRKTDFLRVVVNPAHVKKSKSLDDNSPTKTDRKDAKVIAKLVIDGRYSVPHMPEKEYADLRVAMTHRERLVKDIVNLSNKIQQLIDKYFPEYSTVFKKWDGKASAAVLKELFLPELILEKTEEEIVEIFRKGANRAVGIKRARKLKKAALSSIGIKEGGEFARLELNNLIEQYELLTKQKELLEEKVEKLLENMEEAKYMESVKGVGLITVAGFIAEVGDIKDYNHPKQIQKLAGLNLKEHSSGKHLGQTRITKRGRPKLRALLYRVMLPILANNQEFKQLHEYYTTRRDNPLKPKQSMIALACKLIRIFFALGQKHVMYDGEKLMNDIERNLDLQEAA
ncbi:Transposase [Halanaerobium congolense]|jgi:transposase|uniref:Transposase n=1 Tax=Halanaerobium congolense TaxID=54121 RepID=A0A1G8K7S1_9FIRM|nr:IS110 family transposase [Halanaerobium congolense]KXS48227.1 MAG: transposase [Halanaerobium sp. T82-1]PUU93572.1 MAG: transposase [Halanaerobium sp.]PXV59377.1 transposase [Halanaerobium congolense]TDS33123.1 transposase [Halanaerobium congolense]SDI39453.1 Transposase [Halanaerobium congolense]